MIDDQNRTGAIDSSAAVERSDSAADAHPRMVEAAADTSVADATNRPLLSRNSAQQPRKSLFRR